MFALKLNKTNPSDSVVTKHNSLNKTGCNKIAAGWTAMYLACPELYEYSVVNDILSKRYTGNLTSINAIELQEPFTAFFAPERTL